MKKAFKLIVNVTVSILICFCTVSHISASGDIPEATSEFYVNDFANVFSDKEESKLIENALLLANEEDGIQVVVTTIKSLNGEPIEDYAYDMYNKYGIGKNDMGLLILLSTEDREIRVEVGRAMEGYINDSKAGRIIDKYAIPYLVENKFNDGLINLQENLISEVKKCVASEQTNSTKPSIVSNVDIVTVVGVIGVLIGLTLVVFAVIIVVKKINKRKEYITDLNKEIETLQKNEELLKASYSKNIESLECQTKMLKSDKEALTTQLKEIQEEMNTLKERHQRVLKIYPDADCRVNDMIEAELIEKDKEAASKVDKLIDSVIHLVPSMALVDKLSNAISSYSNLNVNQRQYIKSDIQELKKLYNDSVKLKQDYERKIEQERIRKMTEQRKNKASAITKEILGIIALVGVVKASDLSRLKNAKRLYDNLDYETQKYVDDSAISKLDNLIAMAKRRKDEEEEEERKRRRQEYERSRNMRSFSSSFGNTGFGGRSNGGGASRRF